MGCGERGTLREGKPLDRGCRSFGSRSGWLTITRAPPPRVPEPHGPLSEISSRVYTRGRLSDGLGIPMSCAQGKRASETGSRQKPRPMCTHGTGFLASRGSGGASVSTTPQRVYTREGLSDGIGVLIPRYQGKRASEDGPRQEPCPMCTRGTYFLTAAGTAPPPQSACRSSLLPLPEKGAGHPSATGPPSSRLRRLYSVK